MLGVILLTFGIGGLLLPREYRVERSVVVEASPEVVFYQVDDLGRWERWFPWFAPDAERGWLSRASDGRAGPEMEEGLARLKMISEGFDHGDLIGGASDLEEVDDEDPEPADDRTSAQGQWKTLQPKSSKPKRSKTAEPGLQ